MLEVGMIIKLPHSGLAEVMEVNESFAHVRSLTKEKVKIHSPLNGDAEFSRSGRQWDISPNSEVEIVASSEYGVVRQSEVINNEELVEENQ